MKRKIIKNILLFITLLLFFLSVYIKINFEDVSFEQLIYSALTSKGSSTDVIVKGAVFVLIGTIVSTVLINVLYIIKKELIKKLPKRNKTHIYITFKYKLKSLKIDLLEFTTLKKNILFGIFLIVIIIVSMKLIGVDEFLNSQLNSTSIFDDYYVSSKDVDIEFPDDKKNLIYIYVESLEMTNASKENGGALDVTYIPNLEQLALSKDNINFSNTEKLGGALTLTGTEWTAAAMISQTAGIPLKLSIDVNHYYGYGDSLPGIYNLGDILKKNGYSNYLFIGSDADFGGRKDYFTYHGDYIIYDYIYAKENGWIDDDYMVWWGYEDKKLFDFAKKQLLEISEKDEPFNFTMLTADTHFTDGYLDDSCETPFDTQYANSFNCSDKMLNDFINWIKEQDFYENTTIIITGDHLTMQQGFYNNISSDYNRNVYNVFINSKEEPNNTKNRIFSSMDMFPTTLASLGVKIDGDMLGLGVNLFSNKETLLENLGYDYVNNELKKKSFFYDNYLLGSTYYEMQETLKQKEK